MSLRTLIDEGWERHDVQSATLATELEQRGPRLVLAEELVDFLKLANHTIGEHLADWPRAAKLAAACVKGISDNEQPTLALAYLGAAQTLAGEVATGHATELRFLQRYAGGFSAATLIYKTLLLAGLAQKMDWIHFSELQSAVIDLIEFDEHPRDALRIAAITHNNIASELLHGEQTPPHVLPIMQRSADAASACWQACGTWLNWERAEYLQALVALRGKDFAASISHAKQALTHLEDNATDADRQPVDEAFIHLTMASAYFEQEQPTSAAGHLAKADQLADDFDDTSLTSWYSEEREKLLG